MPLLLASTSRYRRELLERLRLPFHVARPDVDETTLPDEAPAALAARLARLKATAIAAHHPEAWVIGADQVAEVDGQAIGKPGHRDAAIAQLTTMSGRAIRFHTALCLLREAPLQEGTPAESTLHEASDVTTVRFRRCRPRKSNATWMPSSRSTAPAASRARGWASPCSRASTRRTRPP